MNKSEAVLCWKTIVFAYRTVVDELEYKLKEKGFSISKFQILYMLYFQAPLKPVHLAKEIKVSKANISTFIKRMKMEDLVKEVYLGGEKWPHYELTSKGSKIFEEVFPDHVDIISQLIKPMPQELMSYLLKIIK